VKHDTLRDEPVRRDINLLVLSNVVANSTPYKLEKLRDIIALYSNIPKIVVTSDGNPIEFFAQQLHLPINHALWIGSKKRKSHTI
jgi:hypothetical protein